MNHDLVEEIETLQQELAKKRKEERDQKIQSLVALVLEDRGEAVSHDEEKREEEQRWNSISQLGLCCLLAAAECRLIQEGRREYEAALEGHLSELLRLAAKAEYGWQPTDETRSDVLDLLVALSPDSEKIWQKKMAPYGIPPAARALQQTTPARLYLFKDMADFYRQTGRQTLAGRVLGALCRCSRSRDQRKRHQDVIHQVWQAVGMSDPDFICGMAQEEENLFRREISWQADDFYWLYGCCLEQKNRPEQARTCFARCYVIRKQLCKQRHFLTAAAAREAAFLTYFLSGSQKAYEDLAGFVRACEAGAYNGEADTDTVDLLEGKTAYLLLCGRQFDHITDLQVYEEMLRIYLKICRKYPASQEPMISIRLGWNAYGNYYMQTGDFIQAEAAFRKALEARPVPGVAEILAQAQIKSNLLLMYYMQNDLERAIPLLDELMRIEDQDQLMQKDQLRIYILWISIHTQNMIEMEPKEQKQLKQEVNDICSTFLSPDTALETCPREMALLLINAAIYLYQTETASQEELDRYLQAIQKVEQYQKFWHLSPMAQLNLSFSEAVLIRRRSLVQAEKYIQKALQYLPEGGISLITRMAIYQVAADLAAEKDDRQGCLKYLDKALQEIESAWHTYVRYANDTRLAQILILVQLTFDRCYIIYRKYLQTQELYEVLIRFKMLASLAGRERNRIIREGKVDPQLIGRIHKLENHLAALNAEVIFQGQEEQRKAVEKELREQEEVFARRFPTEVQFIPITLDRVVQAMPDQAVVLEYVTTVDKTRPAVSAEKQNIVIDLYILSKKRGAATLCRQVIRQGEQVDEMVDSFLKILQDMSLGRMTAEQSIQMEQLRMALYQALLAPAADKIQDGQSVYIAPDQFLINLPFGLLDEEEEWASNHHMVKIECGRDFLFHQVANGGQGHGSLVLGNPACEIRMLDARPVKDGESLEREAATDLPDLEPLPFSELEAEQVAAHLNTRPLMGKQATKQTILSAGGCRNIHIAAHGFCDCTGEEYVLYDSCLFLAGAKNWLESGSSLQEYGNGILTADEISRLDLQSVHLVVLSSCMNGWNDSFIGKGFQGMVSGFAAAGADYVIASLWSVPESLGVVLLMDKFYDCYQSAHDTPPAALERAKAYLRRLTVGELRRQGWFETVRRRPLNSEVRRSIDRLERCADRMVPFKNEIYWGGFICYRCNGF